MTILILDTDWTAEEAVVIDDFLDAFKEALWEHYGEQMGAIYAEQYQLEQNLEHKEQADDFNDDIPF